SKWPASLPRWAGGERAGARCGTQPVVMMVLAHASAARNAQQWTYASRLMWEPYFFLAIRQPVSMGWTGQADVSLCEHVFGMTAISLARIEGISVWLGTECAFCSLRPGFFTEPHQVAATDVAVPDEVQEQLVRAVRTRAQLGQ